MEYLVEGKTVDEAWVQACVDMSASGGDPRELPGARRAAIRFRRQGPIVLAIIEEVNPSTNPIVERELHSADGEIEGRPDLILVNESGLVVIDYKTSNVAVDGAARPEYVRQIRVYAGLATDTYVLPTVRGILLSTRQGAIDVTVSPELIDDAMSELYRSRAAYNSRVPGPQPDNADPLICRWCPYRARCDGFWSAVGPSWTEDHGLCVRAVVLAEPETALNDLAALQVEVVGGMDPTERNLTIAGVPSTVATTLVPGDTIAMVGLSQREETPQVARWTERSSLWRTAAAS